MGLVVTGYETFCLEVTGLKKHQLSSCQKVLPLMTFLWLRLNDLAASALGYV